MSEEIPFFEVRYFKALTDKPLFGNLLLKHHFTEGDIYPAFYGSFYSDYGANSEELAFMDDEGIIYWLDVVHFKEIYK